MKVGCVCACGGSLEADSQPVAIEHAVRVHQATTEHIAYVALAQLVGDFVAAQPMAGLWRVQGGARPA